MSTDKRQRIKGYIEISLIVLIILGFGGGAVYFDRYVRSDKPKVESKDSNRNDTLPKANDSQAVTASAGEDKKTSQIKFSSNNPINEVHSILNKYGCRMTGIINIDETVIPASFQDKDGEIPIGLYWSYCNELSKAMGLDFSKYKGEKVKRYVISIVNQNNREESAVILVNSERILGAWVLSSDANFKTFNGKSFKDVVATAWETWLTDSGFENYNSSYNQQLKKQTPQQMINKYFNSIAQKDYKSAFMLFSRYRQSNMIAAYAEATEEEQKINNFILLPFYNARQIDIGTITDRGSNGESLINFVDSSITRKEIESKQFSVHVRARFLLDDSNASAYEREVYIYMIKENKDAPWKIERIDW